MINIKTHEQIKIMQEGGKINEAALQETLKAVKAGVKTIELDKVAFDTITRLGGEPAFKRVPGYAYTTCINVNDGLVHGIPNDYVIKPGDLIKVDVGTFLRGFNTDLSYTVEVETSNESKFLSTGIEAIDKGIQQFVIGNRVGAISNAIQRVIEGAGYSVSRDLVGHGVGEELHEEPYVPGYGRFDDGAVIKEGMVFAIEAIYQKGKPAIRVLADEWTIATKDGSLAGLFEKTVAATKDGPLVICGY
jgi:methionyl aminopeptidase